MHILRKCIRLSDNGNYNFSYKGTCSEFPPSQESTSQHLWPLLGRYVSLKIVLFFMFCLLYPEYICFLNFDFRTLSDNCRDILIQVYCAFQYNKNGLCVPPVYYKMVNNIFYFLLFLEVNIYSIKILNKL